MNSLYDRKSLEELETVCILQYTSTDTSIPGQHNKKLSFPVLDAIVKKVHGTKFYKKYVPCEALNRIDVHVTFNANLENWVEKLGKAAPYVQVCFFS